ncbi:MAG TPA: polysaccharide pyruvyl transferase family protein [Anaerolineae bacterium]|mgnify:CR=1 FL=1|nr:polysaccharide pyruvyl transferase family protein [Anaerolineae bacterium]
MRILLDQGVYDLRNKGNIALLQVAVNRISKIWPDASLQIITLAPYILRLYCPSAYPINPNNPELRSENNSSSINKLISHTPLPVLRLLLEARELAWRHWPHSTQSFISTKFASIPSKKTRSPLELSTDEKKPGTSRQDLTIELIRRFDLFIATGAQYMSDACVDDALRVLDRLEAAALLGIPTAMVGQGLGPFENSDLRSRAKAVLPRVDLIFIREKKVGPALLESFGVNPDRVIFTGDDAIEMAYQLRTKIQGSRIGISMRVAHYTQVNNNHLDAIRTVLHRMTSKYNARLMSVPISHSAHELDDVVIQTLLAGRDNAIVSPWRFDTPREIIKQVGYCRIVVTGAFHTAVFALSQGIPAVCLANSTMYFEKFSGLADQFGVGCWVVDLSDRQLQEKLTQAVDAAWMSAEQVKPQLLEAAARQIKLGQAAYQKLFEVVELKKVFS